MALIGVGVASDDDIGAAILLWLISLFVGGVGLLHLPIGELPSPTNSGSTMVKRTNKEDRKLSAHLKETRQAMDALKQHLEEKVVPLKLQYQRERSSYLTKLKPQLKASGLQSHEALLRGKEEHLALSNLLERTAILEHSIQWLQEKEKTGERTLLKLDQEVWRMEKLQEMREVATKEDLKSITEIMTTAQAVIDEAIPLPERQDLALMEQDLFTRLLEAP